MNISAIQSQAPLLLSQTQSQGLAVKPNAQSSVTKADGDGDHGVEPGKGQHINKLG